MRRLVALLTIVTLFPALLHAAVISVNVYHNTNHTLDSGSTAGVEPAQNWNNVTLVATGASLTDSSGAETSATADISGSTWYTSNVSYTDPDARLMEGYGYHSTKIDLSISSLPTEFTEKGYKVLVYMNEYAGKEGTSTYASQKVTLDETESFYILDDEDFAQPVTSTSGTGTFVEATTSGSPSSPVRANYLVFDGLSDSSFSISFADNSVNYSQAGTDRSNVFVSGIQVVAIPEPASFGLLVLCIGLISLPRTRR